METDGSLQNCEYVDLLNCTVVQLDGEGASRSMAGEEGGENGVEGLLRLPEMADTSMDRVGQPLRDVMDRLNGALDKEEPWDHLEEEDKKSNCNQGRKPLVQQPFREDSGGKPPDPATGEQSHPTLGTSTNLQHASPALEESCCFTPNGPDAPSAGGGHYDPTEHSQSQTLSGGHEDEGQAKASAGQEHDMKNGEEDAEGGDETDENKNKADGNISPSESSHPAEFR